MSRRSRFLDGTFLKSGITRPRGIIRSIQRDTVSVSGAVSATKTITGVVLANAIIRFLGNTSTTTTANDERAQSRVELTDATTVTGYKSVLTDTSLLGFEVIEFFPGVLRYVKRGTITLATVATNTDTVAVNNTARASLDFLGFTADNPAAATLRPDNMYVKLILTSATVVTADRVNTGGTLIVGYQVSEFY